MKAEEGCSHCTHNGQRAEENTGLPGGTRKFAAQVKVLRTGFRSTLLALSLFYITLLDSNLSHTFEALEKYFEVCYTNCQEPVMFLRHRRYSILGFGSQRGKKVDKIKHFLFHLTPDLV